MNSLYLPRSNNMNLPYMWGFFFRGLLNCTVLIIGSSFTVCAQGLVNFANLDLVGGVNAPVYETDTVTPLSGSQFMAELLGGDSVNNLVSIATTGFLTGSGAGYFTGGDESIPGVLRGSTAWIQVRVWNTALGASFGQAQNSGLANSWWQSSVFTVVAGGGLSKPQRSGAINRPRYLSRLSQLRSRTVFIGIDRARDCRGSVRI